MKIRNRGKQRVPKDFPKKYSPVNGDCRGAALNLFQLFLLSEDNIVCEELSYWMRQMGSKSLVRPLMDAARYLPPHKHELAVYTLAALFDKRSTPFFRKMWRNTNLYYGIRCVSLEGLGWNLVGKHRRLGEELQLAVRDTDNEVVMSVACILTYSRHSDFIGIRDMLLMHPGSSCSGRSIAEFVRTKVLPWTT